MFMNIIFSICLYPTLFIIYFVMKGNSKPKKNIILGVTLPTQYLEAPEVTEICKEYNKRMKKYTLLTGVIPIFFFLIPYISISTMVWMHWLMLLIIVSSLPYVQCNKKLSLLKAKKQWQLKNSSKVNVDTRTLADRSSAFHKPAFFPPILLSILPVLYIIFFTEHNTSYFVNLIVLLSFGFTSLLFFLIALVIERRKSEVISLNSDINTNYNRAKKHIWENCFLKLSWVNTLYIYLLWASLADLIRGTLALLLITMLYTVILLYLCFHFWMQLTGIVQKYTREAQAELDEVAVDDDKNWLWGMLYYNPNEGATMVDKRYGYGMTINMASKAGKFLAGFSFLALLTIPILSVWLIFEEFTPVTLNVTDHQLIALQIHKEYDIELSQIKEIKLISVLPQDKRLFGTGMDNLEKGTFSVEGYGECQLCLNPQNSAFLVINANNKTYIFSGRDNNATKEVYRRISKLSGA